MLLSLIVLILYKLVYASGDIINRLSTTASSIFIVNVSIFLELYLVAFLHPIDFFINYSTLSGDFVNYISTIASSISLILRYCITINVRKILHDILSLLHCYGTFNFGDPQYFKDETKHITLRHIFNHHSHTISAS